VLVALAPLNAAVLLLDTGVGDIATERIGDEGFGQGVSVGTTTTITNIAMYMQVYGTGQLKFMIWDGSNSSLLHSVTSTAGASSPGWVVSPDFSFTLNAGNTYYFGVIGDSGTPIDGYLFFPATTGTANGLTYLDSGNSNYLGYSSPSFDFDGFATMSLRLYGADTAVPEPSTAFMLGSGLGLLALALHRKTRQTRD